MNTLSKLVMISRPISWPNTAYPFAAAYLVTGGEVSLFFWLATLFFLVPYNLLMYGINDVFDYESDIQNPRKGGIEGMREERAFHPTVMRASVLTTLPFIIYMSFYGDFVSNLVLSVVIFFVIAYSAAGLRFKEIPLLDSFTSSVHFAGPMVYAMVLTGFEASYLPFIVAFTAWGMASHAFGAVQDIIPDRLGKIHSIATVLGARWTVRFAIVLYLMSGLALVDTQNIYAYAAAALSLLYVLNIVSFRSVTDNASGETNRAWRRFIWLNYFSGFIITLLLIMNAL